MKVAVIVNLLPHVNAHYRDDIEFFAESLVEMEYEVWLIGNQTSSELSENISALLVNIPEVTELLIYLISIGMPGAIYEDNRKAIELLQLCHVVAAIVHQLDPAPTALLIVDTLHGAISIATHRLVQQHEHDVRAACSALGLNVLQMVLGSGQHGTDTPPLHMMQAVTGAGQQGNDTPPLVSSPLRHALAQVGVGPGHRLALLQHDVIRQVCRYNEVHLPQENILHLEYLLYTNFD